MNPRKRRRLNRNRRNRKYFARNLAYKVQHWKWVQSKLESAACTKVQE